MATTPRTTHDRIVRRLLQEYGTTWSEEAGLHLERNTPSVLFRWLCVSLLLSARISNRIAIRAARALAKQGWTTAEKIYHAPWDERAQCLKQSGYARYDERTSTMLGQTAELLLDRYAGDLRQLRDAAEHDPAQERKLFKEFRGIGDVGADIFFREVQVAWKEWAPFADQKALGAAKKLKLPGDAKKLAKLVKPADFPRLVVALVRTDLNKAYDAIREASNP